MKLRTASESLIERLALWLGLAPVPLIETHMAATLARAVMAGTALGLFEALAAGPLSPAEIAARCDTDAAATSLLLDALAASDYVAFRDGRYVLTRQSRKYLLADSPHSIRAKILLQAIEWEWLAQLEVFVRTGTPLDFHARMTESERDLYHRSMRALAGLAGGEVGRRTRLPKHARLMLDLGGSHGHFAAAICRRHPALQAQVMDFPEAIAHAAPLLAREGLGNRVVHVAGDATCADLGTEKYDLVLMSNLAHHLDAAENAALAARVARALTPGGVFVIQEPVPGGRRHSQTASFLGLYFALQSRAGVRTWSVDEMRDWQSRAGLRPYRAVALRTAPGWVQQAAVRA
jgi:SAM-dependent methyltransferase